MEVTGKQLKEIAYIRRITSWTCDHCSVCDYPIKYVFQGSYPEVIFDPGCTCTIEVAKLDRYDHSSWDEVAAFINMQSDSEKVKEIVKFWALDKHILNLNKQ